MTETTNDWWAGTSEEYMNIGGPFATREDAIKEGRHDQGGDPFCIVRAGLHEWQAPDADAVIDQWIDSCDELWYEDGFPGFVGPNKKERVKAATDDLQAVLSDWFQRHRDLLPTPTAFAYSTTPEWVDQPTVEEEPSQ